MSDTVQGSLATFCDSGEAEIALLLIKADNDNTQFLPIKCPAHIVHSFVFDLQNKKTGKSNVSIYNLTETLINQVKDRYACGVDLLVKPDTSETVSYLVLTRNMKMERYPINNISGILLSRWLGIPLYMKNISKEFFMSSEHLEKSVLIKFQKGDMNVS